jgi:hypothetical protein
MYQVRRSLDLEDQDAAGGDKAMTSMGTRSICEVVSGRLHFEVVWMHGGQKFHTMSAHHVPEEHIMVTIQRMATCDTPEEGGIPCTALFGYCVTSAVAEVKRSKRLCLDAAPARGSETAQ